MILLRAAADLFLKDGSDGNDLVERVAEGCGARGVVRVGVKGRVKERL